MPTVLTMAKEMHVSFQPQEAVLTSKLRSMDLQMLDDICHFVNCVVCAVALIALLLTRMCLDWRYIKAPCVSSKCERIPSAFGSYVEGQNGGFVTSLSSPQVERQAVKPI